MKGSREKSEKEGVYVDETRKPSPRFARRDWSMPRENHAKDLERIAVLWNRCYSGLCCGATTIPR